MLNTALKNIVPNLSYDFLKIVIHLYRYNYWLRENLKLWYLKIAFMYLLEKTTHPKVLKLSVYLPWGNIYRFYLWIWEILIFTDIMGQKLPKIGVSRIWKLRGCLFRSGHLIFWTLIKEMYSPGFEKYHISKKIACGRLLFFVLHIWWDNFQTFFTCRGRLTV